MYKTLILGATAFMMSQSALASVVKVDFDVTISHRYTGYNMEDMRFQPLVHQKASLVFDNTLTRVDRYWDTNMYPINSHVATTFGTATSTAIASPVSTLMEGNPFPGAPVTASSNMTSRLAYSFAPGSDQVSYGRYVGASTTLYSRIWAGDPYSYAGASWEHSVYLSAPVDYLGMFTKSDIDNYNFTSADLMDYLFSMQKAGTSFNFEDHTYYEERPSLFNSRVALTGTAVISRITVDGVSEVPEPASLALFGLGAAGFVVASRACRKGKRRAIMPGSPSSYSHG